MSNDKPDDTPSQRRDACGPGCHSFNSEDAEVCECGAMNADGSYIDIQEETAHLRKKVDWLERNSVLRNPSEKSIKDYLVLSEPAVPEASTQRLIGFVDYLQRRATQASPVQEQSIADGCDRLRRALAQNGEGRVPEGWKLVPVQPTEEMIEAVRGRAVFPRARELVDSDYRDMLAAAPEPDTEKNDE